MIFEDIKNEYPIKEQRIVQEISIPKPISTSDKIHSQIRGIELALFYQEDRKSLIQAGPRTLSINRLKPYDSWSEFKSRIEYAFQKLSGRVEINGIQKISLRYINKIEIPTAQNKVTLENYFEFRPFCGERLPQIHHGFVVGCVFPFSDDGRDLCKVELRDAMSEVEGSMAFLLNFNYVMSKPRSLPVTQSMEWIEEAHGNIENLFEGSILPPLREIFEEAKE